jgi:hypothetical protein
VGDVYEEPGGEVGDGEGRVQAGVGQAVHPKGSSEKK